MLLLMILEIAGALGVQELSLNTCEVSEDWQEMPGNYRPVNLTSVVRKLVEYSLGHSCI